MSYTLRDFLTVGGLYETVILRDEFDENYLQAHCSSMQLMRDFIRHLKKMDVKFVNKVSWNTATHKYFIKFYYCIK